jgi:hypothetical protein
MRARPFQRRSFLVVPLVIGATLACAACASTTPLPDPKVAAEAFASAAERGDGGALYAMMTRASRASRTEADVKATVDAEREELRAQAIEVRKADVALTTVARLRYADGAEVTLTLSSDGFRVASAGLLPGGGASPDQAIASLREALKRRSYPALLRVLSPDLRAAVEAQLRGLIDALDDPATRGIEPGTQATVTVPLPDGHSVTLRRDGTTWFIENFK